MAKGRSNKTRKKENEKNLYDKRYEAEIFKLQAGLVKLQQWVKARGLKVIAVFEGRDAAGKGGAIKRITERVSPRLARN